MFKSITYVKCVKCSSTKTSSFIYQLIDTNFECEVKATAAGWAAGAKAKVAPLAMEYERRNIPVVSNIFRCNLSLCEEWNYSFTDILKWQYEHIDKYYPELHFNEKYYNKLKDKWDIRQLLL